MVHMLCGVKLRHRERSSEFMAMSMTGLNGHIAAVVRKLTVR